MPYREFAWQFLKWREINCLKRIDFRCFTIGTILVKNAFGFTFNHDNDSLQRFFFVSFSPIPEDDFAKREDMFHSRQGMRGKLFIQVVTDNLEAIGHSSKDWDTAVIKIKTLHFLALFSRNLWNNNLTRIYV